MRTYHHATGLSVRAIPTDRLQAILATLAATHPLHEVAVVEMARRQGHVTPLTKPAGAVVTSDGRCRVPGAPS